MRGRLQSGARDDEAGLVRGDHGLCSVAKPELAQHEAPPGGDAITHDVEEGDVDETFSREFEEAVLDRRLVFVLSDRRST